MDHTEDELLACALETDPDDCLAWLDVCDAACCRTFRFRLAPDAWIDRKLKKVIVHMQLTEDMQRYYELHGADPRRTAVLMPEELCETVDGVLVADMPCTALTDDCRCELHPDDKPHTCRDLSYETTRTGTYWTPPTCLYAYRLRAEGGRTRDEG